MNDEKGTLGCIVLVIVAFFILVGGWMWLGPKYRIYRLGLRGQASLAEAEWDRKIAVAEAQAKLDAAKLLQQAEIVRAEGVAEANRIIADGLGGPEGYLRYLWIDRLSTRGNIIYVPTEAGLPILEAGRGVPAASP